eukprot:6212362-Pleurochrysis_carterae.AAC.3
MERAARAAAVASVRRRISAKEGDLAVGTAAVVSAPQAWPGRERRGERRGHAPWDGDAHAFASCSASTNAFTTSAPRALALTSTDIRARSR